MTQTLCSVNDVQKTINTVGRWSDTEIVDIITLVDDLIHVESGTPVQQMYSWVGEINSTIQNRYYVGEENIYRIDRVFYGTTSKTEAILKDEYKTNTQHGMIEILPVASSGITLTVNESVEIHYVPKIYNQLSLYRTCQRLLEQLDTTSGGETSKELTVINDKLQMVETILAHRVGIQISSSVQNYDSVYGVNRKRITQNFDRNKYIGSTGWDE